MVVLAAVTAQSAAAQDTTPPPAAPIGPSATVAVPSTRIADRNAPAALLHPAAETANVTVSVAFKPRRPALLARLASTRSGASAIPMAELRELFAPASTETAGTTAYLKSHGLHLVGSGFLTRSYSGSVASAEAAFGTNLATYRSAGVTFRSPVTAPQLPVTLAQGIASIGGLDTFPAAKPAAALPAALPNVSSGCTGSNTGQANYGGYQPNDFAQPKAYDFQTLLNAGDNGSGDSLAVVEFSNYTASTVTTYQSCYGTSVPITNVNVSGGPTDSTGNVEVELDQEIVATAAPGLDHLYSYNAPNVGFPAVLDAIVNDQSAKHINEVSISWGLCEAEESPSEVSASDADFQLLAAAGVSVYASSGDDGSSGCHGVSELSVSYPASDPYVTGVGGTTLHVANTGANREVSWGTPASPSGGAGGGGISTYFTMPAWQTGTGVVNSYSDPTLCGQTTTQCREVPDVALDANPDTGYIVNVSGYGWVPIGGTSAATPLLAAMTANANTYSLAHSGVRLGFAAPFFYAHPDIVRDLTVGSNKLNHNGPEYPATAGYDLSTGLGSPTGSALAQSLAGTSFDHMALSALQAKGSITSKAGTTFHGTLTDTVSSTHPAGATIIVRGNYSFQGKKYAFSRSVLTNGSGNWTLTGVNEAAVKARMQWSASYAGDLNHAPAASAPVVLHVLPIMTVGSGLKWNGSTYKVAHGKAFKLTGTVRPILKGQKLVVQYRAKGASKWHATTLKATVGAQGGVSIALVFSGPLKEQLRWAYAGSSGGQWLTAYSPGRLFTVS
jgi:kumamolisin